jgi:glutamate synthase (ferredoxin)
MSGGIAYVLDEDGTFKDRCNLGMVELGAVTDRDEITRLHTLISRHFQYTDSAVARRILDNWSAKLAAFVRVLPTEYRLVLERQHLDTNSDLAKLAAV